MFKLDFITLFAAFGAFQGLAFALVLWFRKGAGISNRIFSLLLLTTSIRIAKNIVVHASELDPDFSMPYATWRLLIYVGLTHQFAIGPLFVLYFLSRTQSRFTIKRSWYLHFIPYLLLLVTSPFHQWPFWQNYALYASYVSILLYYLWAFAIYRKAVVALPSNGNGKSPYRWLRDLLAITGLLLLVYSPALFKYMGYIGGAFLYAVGLYAVSAMLLQQNRFFSYFQKKYPGSSVTSEKSDALLKSLQQQMEEEALYLDPGMSLSMLAEKLGVSSNVLSQLINSEYQQSFSDYINAYRVNKAKTLLVDPAYQSEKVATIAFDSGFNSLSRFNTVFKKVVGLTPSQYKKQFSEK